MKNSLSYFLSVVALSFVAFLLATNLIHAQALDPVADLAARINRERILRGLVPYALSPLLTTAAQAHANDLGRSGKYRSADEGHMGSDGSTLFDRIAKTGYGAFSWGRRLGENWANSKDAASAFSMWMDSAPHRNNILHQVYRELGIGVAQATGYGNIYILDFGAQPNVMPFFINDGAAETRSVDVTLSFSDELAAPNGDGANNIGHPTEIQISNAADFAGSKWQTYSPRVSWNLSSSAGKKTVYVKYRDAKGRTATSNDSIVLNVPATPSPTLTALPTATRTLTRTPRPTNTATATPSATPTDTATSLPTETSTATPTIVSVTPTTAAPSPTLAPSPTMTAILMSANTTDGSSIMGGLGFAVVGAILIAVLKGIGIKN